MRIENVTNQLCYMPFGSFEKRVMESIPAENLLDNPPQLPEILIISSFPPRECGIATYSQDLIKALETKFDRSFKIKICPLESKNEKHLYGKEVKEILNVEEPDSFERLAKSINESVSIEMVMIQHEFGLFEGQHELFKQFLYALTKPIVMVFHTVLPKPDYLFRVKVQELSNICESIIVMTKSSEKILIYDYLVRQSKITVIPHGTHLVPHTDKTELKKKYQLEGRTILSTFGLLSSGKSIETTLDAMPAIIQKNADVLFLIIGKTHPSVVKNEGEKYREMLEAKITELQLQAHVKFVNCFVPLPDLLDYLQLTDVYLFTSKDPNQAVSGTFSYAISCGCPIVSTPIPHAKEVLADGAGLIVDFESPGQLSTAVNDLLGDEQLRRDISSNGLHKMASTAWENTAIGHAQLFERICNEKIVLRYTLPFINLDHIKKMSTDFGMTQFSRLNTPDKESGYTLDDNARAMIAMCQYFELTGDKECIRYIQLYFNFIKHCFQPEGYFLNYVDEGKKFTAQNNTTNLADANGRAIWALGCLLSMDTLMPEGLIRDAGLVMRNALLSVHKIHSTRAMAFVMKGLYCRGNKSGHYKDKELMAELANRLLQMYRHEADEDWQWFENYFTYANGVLPDAMLCAWLVTGEQTYKDVARSSFDFLLSKIVNERSIKVISNNGWFFKGDEPVSNEGGEQPIDVAYTILALSNFYGVFKDEKYLDQMKLSFNWFLGNNHLHQVIYNPCTGGCYDGLEKNHVNLNQGAESTISYLLARLTVEKHFVERQADARSSIYFRKGRLKYKIKKFKDVV